MIVWTLGCVAQHEMSPASPRLVGRVTRSSFVKWVALRVSGADWVGARAGQLLAATSREALGVVRPAAQASYHTLLSEVAARGWRADLTPAQPLLMARSSYEAMQEKKEEKRRRLLPSRGLPFCATAFAREEEKTQGGHFSKWMLTGMPGHPL